MKKNTKRSTKSKATNPNEKIFKTFDEVIENIEEMQAEEDVHSLLENGELLSETVKGLFSLTTATTEVQVEDEDERYNNIMEGLEENFIEIMTSFLDQKIISELEFEDFFTEEQEEEEDDEEEEDSELDSKVDSKVDLSPKTQTKKMSSSSKKDKNRRELEMLMEKVEDESDVNDEDYETESDDEEDLDEEVEVEDDDSLEVEDGNNLVTKTKKNIFNDNEDGEEQDSEPEGSKVLSSFEKQQLALRDQIAALESENIRSNKPWALRGEINARQRPSDSLLEESVEFENLSRPTPQITEERTEEIEDIIRRRISEAAWDDVERKDGRDLTLLNGMKAPGKSARALLEDVATAGPQRSLTQVYEDETQTQLTGTTTLSTEAREKQTELSAIFAKICRHIDGLSGNRFAPKVYAQSDIQIKTLGRK